MIHCCYSVLLLLLLMMTLLLMMPLWLMMKLLITSTVSACLSIVPFIRVSISGVVVLMLPCLVIVGIVDAVSTNCSTQVLLLLVIHPHYLVVTVLLGSSVTCRCLVSWHLLELVLLMQLMWVLKQCLVEWCCCYWSCYAVPVVVIHLFCRNYLLYI